MNSISSSLATSTVVNSAVQKQQVPLSEDKESLAQAPVEPRNQQDQVQRPQPVAQADSATSATQNETNVQAEDNREQQVLARQAAEQAEFNQRQSDRDIEDAEAVSASDSPREDSAQVAQASQQPSNQAQASSSDEDAGLINQQQAFSAQTEIFSSIQNFDNRPEQGGEISVVV